MSKQQKIDEQILLQTQRLSAPGNIRRIETNMVRRLEVISKGIGQSCYYEGYTKE